MLSVTRLEGFPGVPPAIEGLALSVGWPFLFALFAVLTLIFPSGRMPAAHTWWARLGRAIGRWVLPLLLVMTVLADSPDTGASPESVGLSATFGLVDRFARHRLNPVGRGAIAGRTEEAIDRNRARPIGMGGVATRIAGRGHPGGVGYQPLLRANGCPGAR
jgi:hypothetical protein